MLERRDSSHDDPALKEDQGIFKSGVVTVSLLVTPMRRKTSRGDVLCIGYLDDVEVDVVFPGRRSDQCAILMARLDKVLQSANQNALAEKRPMPSPMHVRHPLAVEGTWRVRTTGDENLPERRYQFMVARWRWRDQSGERMFGDLPNA